MLLEVNDEWWAVWVVVSPKGEEDRRERVAYSEHEALVDTAFPLRSIVVKDGAFVLRDRDRRTLATVSVVLSGL